MGYRLTEQAEDDVIRLLTEGGRQFGIAQAERYYDGLLECFAFLETHPLAARERTEIDPPIRAHPFGSHIVIYIVDNGDVLVLGVRHGHEDWLNHDWHLGAN